VRVDLIDAEVVTEDIPGMLVATSDGLTVALDATLTDALRNEGLAREMVNRLQNLRKSSGLDVVDRIDVQIAGSDSLELGITPFIAYIKDEVLADAITFGTNAGETVEIEGEKINVSIFKK
jgi:isoleucyl-tRNA synthetase